MRLARWNHRVKRHESLSEICWFTCEVAMDGSLPQSLPFVTPAIGDATPRFPA